MPKYGPSDHQGRGPIYKGYGKEGRDEKGIPPKSK